VLVEEQAAEEQQQGSPTQAQTLLEVQASGAASGASSRTTPADSSGVLQRSPHAAEAGTAAGGSSSSAGGWLQRSVTLAQAALELCLVGVTCVLLLLTVWEVVVLALVAAPGSVREFAAGEP
jgi:hypothetical protein